MTCGDRPGIRTRSRSQRGSKLCGRTDVDRKDCFVNKCPLDCVYKSWSEWSTCTQSCGTGSKMRTRSIERYQEYGGKPCQGERVERTECTIGNCMVDGAWSNWGPWGYCDRTCGSGMRVRIRECDKPRPENGGKDCDGESLQREQCMIKVTS